MPFTTLYQPGLPASAARHRRDHSGTSPVHRAARETSVLSQPVTAVSYKAKL